MIKEISKDNIKELENSFISSTIINDISNNPFGKILIITNESEIIGFIYYSDIYERAEINQIEIKEEYRNKGYGDKLLKEFINIINKDITLEVKNTNEFAIKLYEKNGFIKTAIRHGYYQGIDGLLMERKNNK